MTRSTCIVLALGVALGFAGCLAKDAGVGTTIDGGHPPDGGGPLDSGTTTDAGTTIDAGHTDAGALDSGVTKGDGGFSAGDCRSNVDCPPDGACVALVDGGYRVCQFPVPPAQTCEAGRGDECCSPADCDAGSCFFDDAPRECSPIARVPFNRCMTDECANDGDCGAAKICAGPGIFSPVRVCVDGACHVDADCTASAGGRCVLYRDSCCSIARGLYCAYPPDGCSSGADCRAGSCDVVDGRARCVAHPPFCPL